MVQTENNAPYEKYNASTGAWEDDVRKDHFAYDEQIAASYINYARNQGPWELQAGLRAEYTHSTGTQVLIGKRISLDYLQLFPMVSIRRKLNDDHQIGLSYARRIDRPNYQDLNPFQRFLDLYTYHQGNPYLSPQYGNNIELTHSYKGELTTTLNYTYTDKVINDVIRQNDETKVVFQTKQNVARQHSFGISVLYAAALTKWWTLSVNGNLYRQRYKGNINEQELDRAYTSFDGNFDSQFNIAKNWTTSVNGSYQGRGLAASMFIVHPVYVLNFGVGKQILKNRGSLKLNVLDPFKWQKTVVEVNHGNVNMFVTNQQDFRRVGITFTYRFSKRQAVQQRKKQSAVDEQKRIG